MPPGLSRVLGEAGHGASPRGRAARVPLAQGPGPGGALFSVFNFARLERGATWRGRAHLGANFAQASFVMALFGRSPNFIGKGVFQHVGVLEEVFP